MEFETVWNGCRDNPRVNGGYLNVDFYPKRDAPALLPRIAEGSQRRRGQQPRPGADDLMWRVQQLLLRGPQTLSAMAQECRRSEHTIRCAMWKLGKQVKSAPYAKTKGRSTSQFWLERG